MVVNNSRRYKELYIYIDRSNKVFTIQLHSKLIHFSFKANEVNHQLLNVDLLYV